MNDYDINSLIDTKLSKRSKDIRLESIKISKANGGIIMEVHFHQLRY